MIHFEKIKSIRRIGKRRCFDISVKYRHKGFLANGIQVHNSDFCVKDAFETFEDGKAFYKKYPEESEIAIAMEGQVSQTGRHAAAMIVSASDLRNGEHAAYANRSSSIVCNWDKEDAEHMGLMKLDVLGLNSLTLLSEARKLINARHGVLIDYETLDMSDAEVYEQFNKGNCLGIFQFNSPGMMRICREIGVEDFEAVVSLNTLHRPGALRSGIVHQFRLRKHGEEPVTYIHPFIKQITEMSYGLIIYQEQMMRFMYELGGLGWRTADTIRKVVSKSKGVEQFMSFKQQFVDGCKRLKTLDEKTASAVFEELKHMGSYCLTGDTKIYRVISKYFYEREMTLKEAFGCYKRHSIKPEHFEVLSMQKDGSIKTNRIKNIYSTGKQECFLLRTVSGKKIRSTAEHRFLIDGKWKKLKHAKAGDLIRVTDLKKPALSKKIGHYSHLEEIIEIKPIGTKDTYDVEMVGEPRNFVANNFISHNSFNRSHAVEYSLIAVWMMWLKVHYPSEFMATILTHGSDSKKAENINEVRRLGIKILLPDINKSAAKQWIIDENNNLLIPLSEIKGVGEIASAAIIKERETNGPFKDFDNFESRLPKRTANTKVKKLLQATQCFGDDSCREGLDEAKLEELSGYFDFSLSNDPMYRYRKIIKLLGEHITIRKLKSLDDRDNSSYFYFGFMDKLKFGYKERGDGKVMRDIRGTVGDLGGVYGNFKDDTDFIMIVFGHKFYLQRKVEIEHSEGKWMLAYAKNEIGKSNIWTDKFWFGDDLLAGKVDGLELKLAKPAVYPKGFLQKANELNLPACNDCELRSECSAPVMPSLGQFNMMIAGEAPGRDEDRLKKGFIGDSGNGLWKRLSAYGLDRELFHTTNICKCWPSKTKTPKNAHIKACSKYLLSEIETVKPFIILSFGNTGLKFFKEQESGIMAANGSCEWSDRFNCWIVYSVHPAAALYSPENKEVVDKGIAAFAEKVAMIGFGV